MKNYLIVLLLLINGLASLSQIDSSNNNLQSYTPSVLLKKGQWEYKFFNNIYTQTQGFDNSGQRSSYGSRGTYFSSINQLLVGVNPKINVGFDVWVKSVHIGPSSSSPVEVFTFSGDSNARTSVTNIGPKIKLAPLPKIQGLSLQSTFLFPTASDPEGMNNGKPFLSADRYIWYTQFFYDRRIQDKFQVFLQLAPWLYIDRKFQSSGTYLASPISGFLSWFPNQRITIYVMSEFWPTYGSSQLFSSYFVQSGGGGKYQIIPGLLELELLYTNFLAGNNSGAGQTYNVGLRLIR